MRECRRKSRIIRFGSDLNPIMTLYMSGRTLNPGGGRDTEWVASVRCFPLEMMKDL